MKENSTTNPWFTRRRVLAAVLVVFAFLTVAGVFAILDGKPAEPVKATFVGFSKSTNDGAPLVVLRLTNESSRAVNLLSHDKHLETLASGFRYRSSTDEITLRVEAPFSHTISFSLFSYSGTTCQVRLPKDGRSGWPAVCSVISPKAASGFRGEIQSLWWRLRPPREVFQWAFCDREIQCPKGMPDGTVEQPRLVLKQNSKSD